MDIFFPYNQTNRRVAESLYILFRRSKKKTSMRVATTFFFYIILSTSAYRHFFLGFCLHKYGLYLDNPQHYQLRSRRIFAFIFIEKLCKLTSNHIVRGVGKGLSKNHTEKGDGGLLLRKTHTNIIFLISRFYQSIHYCFSDCFFFFVNTNDTHTHSSTIKSN